MNSEGRIGDKKKKVGRLGELFGSTRIVRTVCGRVQMKALTSVNAFDVTYSKYWSFVMALDRSK